MQLARFLLGLDEQPFSSLSAHSRAELVSGNARFEFGLRQNRRYRRSGSLFQGRFKAILVENQTHAWELSRYVHLNPVRAKMVQLPEQYCWSSYSAYRFARVAAAAPAWFEWETVLREHSKDLRNARRAYQRFVAAGIEDPPASPEKLAAGGLFLGQASWVEKMRQRLADEPEDANVPQRKGMAWRPAGEAIVCRVQDYFRASSMDFKQARRHGNDARIAAIYLIRTLTSEKVAALAQQFGNVSAAAISKLLSRAELRRQEDPQWNSLLEELEQKCRSKRRTSAEN